jgi:septal ring factor EnvC (AmiA/AmiB activator)
VFWGCCLALAFALATPAGAAAQRATPITKVLDLLNSMLVKGKAEKQDEEVKFAAFSQWCENTGRTKGNEISASAEQIELIGAKIQKHAARIRNLGDRAAVLEEDIGRWKKDIKAAADVRSKESTDYVATARDHQETLDALDGAIEVLKKQNYDRPQAVEALLQMGHVPLAAKKALTSFLQRGRQPDEQLFNSAPEAHGYEFQSGGVIDMLSKLKDEFHQKKYELDQEELNAKHAHLQMTQQLTDSIANAEHELSQKKVAKAETENLKADAHGALAETSSDKEEDENYLADVKSLCASKHTDFESRQKLRGEEIEGLEKAIEIISSGQVAGAGEEHLPSLVQVQQRGVASLVQVRSSRSDDHSPVQEQIAEFLAARGRSCNSNLLAMVSQRVSTDPFVKVKKMIKDLISKLMQEATAETEHKGWCDAELAANKQTRSAKSDEVSKLAAEKDQLSAEIAQLGQDIEDLTAAVAALDSDMATAVSERADAKKTNEEAIAEAKDAQVQVQNAITLLKEYYAKSAEATAFVQERRHAVSAKSQQHQGQPSADAPETFDKPYQGMFPEGGTIVDFLEVVLADFARLEAETSTSEATQLAEHKKFMFESKKSKALKENEKEHKAGTKTERESSLHSTEAELKATQDELDKADKYYETLKPSCVDSGITYEERVARREEEMQSLQEALKILTGQDIDLQ